MSSIFLSLSLSIYICFKFLGSLYFLFYSSTNQYLNAIFIDRFNFFVNCFLFRLFFSFQISMKSVVVLILNYDYSRMWVYFLAYQFLFFIIFIAILFIVLFILRAKYDQSRSCTVYLSHYYKYK